MSKTRKIAYGSLLALAAVLLVLGVFFDKTIADAVYQPENVFSIVMQSVGIFPPFIFISGMFTVLFYLVKKDDKHALVKKILTAVGVVISYLVFGYMATDELLTAMLPRILIAVGVAAAMSAVTFLLFRRTARDRLERYAIFLIFAAMVAVISSLITVNVLKYIWGRPRFREMMWEGDYALEAFTPWYHINGFTLHGHHSFPSGHTAAASGLLVLCALPEVFPEAESKYKTTLFVVAIYIFAMAYSRLVLGAHFLSDVTAGFLIGFVTYAVTRYIYFDKSRLVIDALIRVNSAPITEGESAEKTVVAESDSEPIVEIEIPEEASEGEEIVHPGSAIAEETESAEESEEAQD